VNRIDLTEYGRKIYLHKDNPGELNEINLELAGYFAYYSSQLIPLKLAEATFWGKFKDIEAVKPKSDAYVRALWRITKDGNRMMEIEETLKVLDKLMSTLRTSINLAIKELMSQK